MSLLDFQHINQQIKEKLFEITYKIECFNKSGDSDLSRYAETYFKEILNIIYKKKGWHFEKALKINQDTYDLYDSKNKVCIQITSNNRQSKKDSTITQFINKHQKDFTFLILLFLAKKKPKKTNVNNLTFEYTDYNIFEFGSLIESECNKSDLIKIRDILFPKNGLSRIFDRTASTQNKNIEVTEKEFLRCMKLEKKLKFKLLLPEYWRKIDNEELSKYPYKKFKDSRFILRSIEDESYPNVDDNSNWNRTFMYDFYDKGILIWIDALFGTKAIINKKDEWYIKDRLDKDKSLPKGFFEVNIRILGKLPYKNIVHYKDGDEYYNDYHLYCKYIGVKNSPYEDIIYLVENKLGYFWAELDKTQEINN